MRVAFAMATAIVCAACNSSGGGIQPLPPEDFEPLSTDDPAVGNGGTRLKKRVIEADDGTRQFVGWFDSARGENCAFIQGPDGVQRCMPFELAHKITGPSGLDAIVYTDANCTNAFYLTSTPYRGECRGKVKYVYQSPESTPTCPDGDFYVYEIGEDATVDVEQPMYVKSGLGCIVFNTVDDVFALKATEIPPSAFVGAEETLQD